MKRYNPQFFIIVIASSYYDIDDASSDNTKKRVLLSTNTDPKSRRKKIKKFSTAEDQALCKAYATSPQILSWALIKRRGSFGGM
jgi:hypothetical protein